MLTAQTERPAELGQVNLRTLSPFQRALLVIDGTVTKFIEAYTMEPVEVVRLEQQERQLRGDHPWLEIPAGTTVAARQVMLRGRYSRHFWAYAQSLVVLDRVVGEVRNKLDIQGESIGRMLNARDMETRRDVLWYGRERVDELPDEVRKVCDGEFISRTYRIVTGGKPIMMITEKFPMGADNLPSHH
ncbi:hypothetical protein ABI59_00735 [Acidobacteria bacterium Mor1]|nr:hypothetical protein ABI59_00735 [Acidobacteria bacterium Mor1]